MSRSLMFWDSSRELDAQELMDRSRAYRHWISELLASSSAVSPSNS